MSAAKPDLRNVEANKEGSSKKRQRTNDKPVLKIVGEVQFPKKAKTSPAMSRVRYNLLTHILGIKYPILLAPMGLVSGWRLAAAVSAAGGLGMLGETYKNDAAVINDEFTKASAEYKRLLKTAEEKQPGSPPEEKDSSPPSDVCPVGVGFILFATVAKNPEILDCSLSHRPKLVQLSFGEFKQEYFQKIHSAGSLVCCQIQTVSEALEVAEKGADVIIAQGYESGGHGSSSANGLMVLIPEIVQELKKKGLHTKIPVVAAGGISNGRQLAAAMALGASGVCLGTRFMCSEERIQSGMANRGVDATLQSKDGGVSTCRTKIIDDLGTWGWSARYDSRMPCNDLTEEALKHPPGVIAGDPELKETLRKHRDRSGECYSGSGVGLIDEVLSVETIVRRMVQEAEAQFW